MSIDSPKEPSTPTNTSHNQNPLAPHPPEKSTAIFNHPNLNSSAPALSTIGSSPMMLNHRSATAPSKRLAFASNLSVYDTFSASVYDRRSEPATWSRLTPALAQRIKEELNSYKMEEMEVHASSRIQYVPFLMLIQNGVDSFCSQHTILRLNFSTTALPFFFGSIFNDLPPQSSSYIAKFFIDVGCDLTSLSPHKQRGYPSYSPIPTSLYWFSDSVYPPPRVIFIAPISARPLPPLRPTLLCALQSYFLYSSHSFANDLDGHSDMQPLPEHIHTHIPVSPHHPFFPLSSCLPYRQSS